MIQQLVAAQLQCNKRPFLRPAQSHGTALPQLRGQFTQCAQVDRGPVQGHRENEAPENRHFETG